MPVRLKIGLSPQGKQAEGDVLGALATLVRVLGPRQEVTLPLDMNGATPTAPRFREAGVRWIERLERASTKPDIADQLDAESGPVPLTWYPPSLYGRSWSGRVDGLQVCSIGEGEARGVLTVGSPGSRERSEAHAAFLQVVEAVDPRLQGMAEVRFAVEPREDEVTVTEAGAIVEGLVASRRSGALRRFEPEHALEARILAGETRVEVGGRILRPLRGVGQLPTLWSDEPRERAKPLDVLLWEAPARPSEAGTLWVLEIKDSGLGRGSYYRHAVGQVVLYREFLRQAEQLWPLFHSESRPLNPASCEGAIAFPRDARDDWPDLRADVEYVAELFGVRVVEL